MIVCERPPATEYVRRPSLRSLRSALMRERRLGTLKIVTRPVQRPAVCGHDTVTRIVDGRCRRGLETPSDGVLPELPLVGAVESITGSGSDGFEAGCDPPPPGAGTGPGGGSSSSAIVARATARPSVAPDGADRRSSKLSAGSSAPSSSTATSTVACVLPGGEASVPLRGE